MQITALISPGYIVTSPVVLFVCAHSSPVLCTVYASNDVVGCLGVVIVATLLGMRFWPFSRLALVLYLCTIVTLHVIP